VGKTSLEIRIDISHSDVPEDQVGSAYFLFVARDATDYTKSYKLPELSFESEKNPKKCLIRDEYGKRNKERKKMFSEVFY
jgi:acyl-CoA hydrolase